MVLLWSKAWLCSDASLAAAGKIKVCVKLIIANCKPNQMETHVIP